MEQQERQVLCEVCGTPLSVEELDDEICAFCTASLEHFQDIYQDLMQENENEIYE